jgi:hypothetical protein
MVYSKTLLDDENYFTFYLTLVAINLNLAGKCCELFHNFGNKMGI